jgi:hypothetical protein
VPSTLTVTNNLDSGPGSLRAEITGAQNNDTIVFSPQLYFATIPVTQGELFISKNLTIKGLGANFLTLDAHPRYQYLTSGRVFDVRPGVQVTLSGMTITDGQAGLSGGPLYGAYGGGILNLGRLTISACTISHCYANFARGGGGGIANFGTLTVSQCTLSGNLAIGYFFVRGAGIYNHGTLTVSDSTLSGNVGVLGAGVFVAANSTATLTNCTISSNPGLHGGGIYIDQNGILNLTNTIVAGNAGGDIYGAVATADHNLVGDATGSTGIVKGVNGNIVGGNGNPVINANLGPLQNNGGPTQTMALLAGSPAIGHADNSKAPAKDQRGVTRLDTAGETTDIGAFELTGPGSASTTTFSLTPLGTAPSAGIPVYRVPAAEVTSGNVGNADAHEDMVPFNNTDSAVGRTSDVVLRTTPRNSGNLKTAAVDELFLRVDEASELTDIGAFEL